MLKIKFNINEFTIIFLRRFEGKNECKRISFSLYQLQRPFSCFSVSFLLQRLFLLFLVSATQHRKPLGFISRAYRRVSAWLPHIVFGNIKIFPSTGCYLKPNIIGGFLLVVRQWYLRQANSRKDFRKLIGC